jgi:hypothetical protein
MFLSLIRIILNLGPSQNKRLIMKKKNQTLNFIILLRYVHVLWHMDAVVP